MLKTNINTTPILKSLDEEKRLFTAVVLRPNEIDAHGDIYDSEVVEKAAHDYMIYSQGSNLQHLIPTDQAVVVESYIAKASHTIGNGEIVEGDWIMTMKILDDGLWELCKEGVFTGFSVGCVGTVEMLDD